MSPGEFIKKWRLVELNERSASQSHFDDLCRLLEIPVPSAADPTGEWFTFEKGASKSTGGEGWADVWRKGCFAWEYKGTKPFIYTSNSSYFVLVDLGFLSHHQFYQMFASADQVSCDSQYLATE